MRLFLLTALTMVAFAANSVLNRMALADAAIGPALFAALRLGSGAFALALLVLVQRRALPVFRRLRLAQTGALTLYMLGFSFAYVTLDAGVGALVLFGGVQLTMLAGAAVMGEALTPRRVGGAFLALAGLVVLLWPAGGAQLPPGGALLMAAAGLGWGMYSLAGRGAADPLAATAANFVLATPLAFAALMAFPDAVPPLPRGVALAVVSGVVTSGLGYALWYAVLPRLSAAGAGIAQLSVPLIAAAGGLALLAEVPEPRFALAAILVLGGIWLGLTKWPARRAH